MRLKTFAEFTKDFTENYSIKYDFRKLKLEYSRYLARMNNVLY